MFKFCEAYSGVEFFPYQAQFGKRIIRSVLENDGEEITALFSRQCLTGNSKVRMADGTTKPIWRVEIGEKVLAFDYDEIVEREVTNSYNAGKRDVYKLTLNNGLEIVSTSNHRFLDKGSKLFKPLSEFEADNLIAYITPELGKGFSGIKNIEYVGERTTYDIEVEGAENFIANDILMHNSGKSETVATISGGMAILLPTLANMPMFLTDTRLQGFRNGIMIGIFAPTLRQSQISFSRMKKRMNSKHSQEIMIDPDINLNFDVSNGQNIMLTNGSLISSQSASEGSNVEGDSYMVIIVDEAQDVGNFKYTKSIDKIA